MSMDDLSSEDPATSPLAGMVSVVIPTYRRPDTLATAIRSALRQGVIVKEVLVVDDNRDEQQCSKVIQVVGEANDLRVIHLKNQGRTGGSSSRNVGIRQATAPVVAFLDDDDYWLPGKLVGQIKLLTPGIVGADCGYVEVDETWGLQVEVPGDGYPKKQADLLAGYCPTTTSLVIVRRDVCLEAGLFDETMASFEDYDFWVRCASLGAFATMPRPGCVYVQHSGYRLSLALEGRLRGLEQFLDRWGPKLGDQAAIRKIRSRWRLIALATNARRVLHASRYESLRYALAAIREAPARIQAWQALLFAVLGFRLARTLSRMKYSTRALCAETLRHIEDSTGSSKRPAEPSS
jgi:glycosyltransferase involved in cell wall biosynthesis